ncbi:probable RNA-directed DNA polymerase from transposon X-element [Trichonephila clavipes]|nr:probable RNA-directed DNA polymerase from transposon X-element [Trichonephila clavipes]
MGYHAGGSYTPPCFCKRHCDCCKLIRTHPRASGSLGACPHPHGSINVTELDAILAHNNRTFLFGDFNAKHSSWNPGRSNATGNILSNWAVSSAIDIIAPDTPTHFNHSAPSTVIDIGFAANFSHSNVFTVNELSSDHNPVIFDFVTNCQLPPLLQTLKTTNWIKFQEILHYNMPGNPTVDNFDQAVQNFSNIVSDAINTSTSTRISKTSHLRLPINIRELNKTKNRFRKLWNNTRYPLYKREVNALVRQIRIEINEHKNRTWKNLLSSLNVEDNSLYNLHKRITKKHTVIPPLHGPSGMAFSDFEKAEAFKDTLEVTFQENAEPYSDDKIEEVESLVNHYFDNFNTLTPPLTSPLEVRGIIKKLPNRKSPGPDQIPNIALKYLPINAITHLTKIYNRKWSVIDPQAELTLHWVPVVRYLGLHIDSRLTYKNHIDYLSDKFWGRIALAISLIGRSSPLSLENKVILYKQILRPTITKFAAAGSSAWRYLVCRRRSGTTIGYKLCALFTMWFWRLNEEGFEAC